MVSNKEHLLKVNILTMKEKGLIKSVEIFFNDLHYQTIDIALNAFDMNPISTKLIVFHPFDLMHLKSSLTRSYNIAFVNLIASQSMGYRSFQLDHHKKMVFTIGTYKSSEENIASYA